MVKISNLPPESSPALGDKIPFVDVSESPIATNHTTLQSLIAAIFNNVPSGAIPGSVFDYVVSGGVWSGDAYASTRNASMTAITVYINNRTIAISAVTARTFTASKDTYIDVLDNLDGTGTLVYTEVANNAASPALASNSLRIGIIITGASTIANAGSVNQGQETMVLPIASSVAYSVTDSLGNLICPRDPNRRLLGNRQVTASQTGVTTAVDVTGLSVPTIVPTNRKIKLKLQTLVSSTVSGDEVRLTIAEGATVLNIIQIAVAGANKNDSASTEIVLSPAAGLHTYKATLVRQSGTGTVTSTADATFPAFLRAELL